jgi:hypothetical protein
MIIKNHYNGTHQWMLKISKQSILLDQEYQS